MECHSERLHVCQCVFLTFVISFLFGGVGLGGWGGSMGGLVVGGGGRGLVSLCCRLKENRSEVFSS